MMKGGMPNPLRCWACNVLPNEVHVGGCVALAVADARVKANERAMAEHLAAVLNACWHSAVLGIVYYPSALELFDFFAAVPGSWTAAALDNRAGLPVPA